MKRHVQKTGVRHYFGDDLIELQGEPLKAIDAFFGEYGPCIINGCTVSQNMEGTYDVSAGLVALEAEDTQGVRRVMVMPFAGAAAIVMPLYLIPEKQPVSREYGNGEVKPVAYIYAAKASGVAPDGEVSFLTLTAAGSVRFVDAIQDGRHRFITDSERTKWNGLLDLAQAYADHVSEVDSEAALRSSKEYTDKRERAMLEAVESGDDQTLKTAKEYADRIVAALVDNSPEALDTLQELAAALGNDPNFSTTVLQAIGERVRASDFESHTGDTTRHITSSERTAWSAKLDHSAYTASDVLSKLLTVDGKGSGLLADGVADQQTGGVLKLWRGTEAQYNALAAKDANTLYILTK